MNRPIHSQITYIPPSALKPYAGNARTHNRRQIRQIAASIQKFGFVNPVLIYEDNRTIAGHGRVEAAKLIEMQEVPTLLISAMTEAEKRAYVIADNRLAEKAGWDRKILAIELQALVDLDFEVELTGFDMGEIDLILDDAREAQDPAGSPDDDVPDLPRTAVTRRGEMWLLGDHRLLCGDSRSAAAYDILMDGALARLIVTDPPYNVRIEGNVSGLGAVRHREFAMASGEMSPGEFQVFLETVFGHLAGVSVDGALHFHCMDWRHMGEMLAAGRSAYSELKNLVVWSKTNGGMGSLYRSQHELIFVWKSGTAAHVNNVELGRHGRNRSNVWTYPGVNTFKAGRLDELAAHPTVKPIAMIADAIKDCSHRGDIVLDPFCGSGTILIAAEKTGRKARAIEFEPGYVDVAIRRWEKFTGRPAVLEATGETFEDVEMQRADELSAETVEA